MNYGRSIRMQGQAKTAHCESCGGLNPKTDEGYTLCCNELVCYGNGGYMERFGTETDFVKACCWAEAEKKFAAAGQAIPDGASKL